MMRDASWLDWPFFDDAHRKLAHDVDAWCEKSLGDVDPVSYTHLTLPTKA